MRLAPAWFLDPPTSRGYFEDTCCCLWRTRVPNCGGRRSLRAPVGCWNILKPSTLDCAYVRGTYFVGSLTLTLGLWRFISSIPNRFSGIRDRQRNNFSAVRALVAFLTWSLRKCEAGALTRKNRRHGGIHRAPISPSDSHGSTSKLGLSLGASRERSTVTRRLSDLARHEFSEPSARNFCGEPWLLPEQSPGTSLQRGSGSLN